MIKSHASHVDADVEGIILTIHGFVENAGAQTIKAWDMVVQRALVIDLSMHQVIQINLTGL